MPLWNLKYDKSYIMRKGEYIFKFDYDKLLLGIRKTCAMRSSFYCHYELHKIAIKILLHCLILQIFPFKN